MPLVVQSCLARKVRNRLLTIVSDFELMGNRDFAEGMLDQVNVVWVVLHKQHAASTFHPLSSALGSSTQKRLP